MKALITAEVTLGVTNGSAALLGQLRYRFAVALEASARMSW